MSAALLSVVIPTHNRPDQLRRAAGSVLSQRDVAVELVVVDDASTERTAAVIDELAADPRVRVVRNGAAMGPGGARNRGIAEAGGELLGFCDDDDEWLPGAACALLDHLEASSEVGMVTSWHRVHHDRTGRSATYRGPLTFGPDELLWCNFVALPFVVIRRSHYPDGTWFDPELPTCEDWDVWLRCARIRPIGVVPEVLYSYHQHGGDRVTRGTSGHSIGRQGFLDKHGSAMSPACRIYHQAVIAGQTEGRAGLLERLVAAAPRSPSAAGFAASLLAAGFTASAVGVRRGDPGLPSRVMCRLLRHRRSRGGSEPARGER